MRVLKVDRDRGLALCRDEEDRRESVEIALVEPVTEHEMLLVHAGTALGRAAQDAFAEDGFVGDAVGVDRAQGVAR